MLLPGVVGVMLVLMLVLVVGPGCAAPPAASAGRALTADPGDDASARRTLDAAVLSALGGRGWTVLHRENLPDGGRRYELHSVLDEPGTLLVTPRGEGDRRSTWHRLDADELDIAVRVGFVGDDPANVARAAVLAEAVRERLVALEASGYAPIRGR